MATKSKDTIKVIALRGVTYKRVTYVKGESFDMDANDVDNAKKTNKIKLFTKADESKDESKSPDNK